MRRASLAVLAAGCVLLTAACGAAGGASPPTWEPSPGGNPSEGPGVRISPIVPQPGGGGSGSSEPSSSPQPGSSSSSSGPTSKTDPMVVATKLTTPTGIAMMPDGTALVGERTTGRILRVQPVAGKPTPVVKTISGLDTAGGGGLLDLALSPDFAQDNLIYAYISTATDNRVVEFTLDGPVTTVFKGIPHGAADNSGRIQFGQDGDLYIGTGTAGQAARADNLASLAGKVLRVDAIGHVVSGNARSGSAVYTSGHDGVAGLCTVPQTTTMLEVEQRPGGGEVNLLTAGASYGYPTAGGASRAAVALLPASTPAPGDCAVASGRLWVTSPDGQALLNAPITGSGANLRVGTFTAVLSKRYGRLLTVVPAADGALWLTTTNRDGHGNPVAADERVIRYTPSGGGSQSGSQV